MKGIRIEKVFPGGIGEEIGLKPGDRILRINGKEIRDLLDYRFHISDDVVLVEVEKVRGSVWKLKIEKEPDEGMGIEVEPIKPKSCKCKCIFCFMDQMPPGMRPSLYFKDDDFRLSFLYGNYITLTNLTPFDWRRLEQQRLSPLYVSMHATDPRIRSFMMGTSCAARGFEELKRLISIGIRVHVQIVLCPGINDGMTLEQSIDDLLSLYPGVASLALVPVGLTRYRKSLYPLRPVNAEIAKKVLCHVHELQKKAQEVVGEPFIYPADEWYILSGDPFPPLEAYGELAQLEDGVGMVPSFLHKWEGFLGKNKATNSEPLLLFTGKAFHPYLRKAIALSPFRKWVKVKAVENLFFGPFVSVAGLITGRDLISAIREEDCDQMVLPNVMLNNDGLFIDNLSPSDVEKATGKKISVIPASPEALYEELASRSAPQRIC